ncbi:raiA ribosome-associated inhibitor A [Sorangium cellulosum]|uniref:RaiA ribosome-associated inhibitor A n=1 Tax=Sorangium cellulosum TaxID=56 RepID=A0A4P2Q634_SORCE|nr:HPF/RaiA family ribosome-associated protein [Sorangium cellulosum]AUX24566.1 raiA ribosome-associated inhibitor A [Sorangium cellulosum]
MQVELTFRHIGKSPSLEALIREQTDKIQRFHDHINSCAVVVERDHASQGTGGEYRVRVDLHVAGKQEIVSEERAARDLLPAAVRDVFQRAARQLKKLASEQRNDVKAHPAQDTAGVITKLFNDYGFITTTDGREIYFHERSMVSAPFADLKVGMGVAYTEEEGDKGPQASTVRIVDARGGNRGRAQIPTLS